MKRLGSLFNELHCYSWIAQWLTLLIHAASCQADSAEKCGSASALSPPHSQDEALQQCPELKLHVATQPRTPPRYRPVAGIANWANTPTSLHKAVLKMHPTHAQLYQVQAPCYDNKPCCLSLWRLQPEAIG
eukprot:3207227-Amphidinium_carterae.1